MLKLEHVVLPSSEQMEFVIEGMRNPKNSWDRSDTVYIPRDRVSEDIYTTDLSIGPNDLKLMTTLAQAGTEHRKYMRMMPVMVRITAPLYWWKEFDTYKVGTVANSCSTMHKIAAKEFTASDFSCERLEGGYKANLFATIDMLNAARKRYLETKDKVYWWQMIQLLPSSYNQTRNVMLNYEVLASIYHQRRNHKLDEWHVVCDWIETLPYKELITQK